MTLLETVVEPKKALTPWVFRVDSLVKVYGFGSAAANDRITVSAPRPPTTG